MTGPDNHLSSVYKSGTPGDNKHLLRKKIVTLVVWCRGRDQESPGAAFPWLVPLLVTALVTADGGAGRQPVSSRVTYHVRSPGIPNSNVLQEKEIIDK